MPRLLVIALVALAGCRSRPAAEIVVVVDTDLDPGAGVDRIEVQVNGAIAGSLEIASPADLPGTLTVIPGSEAFDERIEIHAAALHEGELVVRETVRTHFVAGPARELVIFLAARCRRDGGVRPCADELLCTRGGCASPDIAGDALPLFTGPMRLDGGPLADAGSDSAIAPLDAGADAGAEDAGDAGCVPAAEQCNDIDDDCDGSIDETRDNDHVLGDDAMHCGRCDNMCASSCTSGYCSARVRVEAAYRALCGISTPPALGCAGSLAPRYQIGALQELEVSPTLVCGLNDLNRVECRGQPFAPFAAEEVRVDGLDDSAHLTVGRAHVCSIRLGLVYCAGEGARGQLSGEVASTNLSGDEVGPRASGFTDVTDVSAGNDFTCAVTGAGRVRCWGANECEQLGRGETGEDDRVRLVVTSDGSPLTGIVDVACAGGGAPGEDCGVDPAHCCALNTEGQVYCWGHNGLGQVQPGGEGGVVPAAQRVTAVTVRLVAIEVSAGTSCGIDEEGRVHCWGDNRSGLFTSTEPGPGPAQLALDGPIRQLSLSVAEYVENVNRPLVHAVALAWDGTVYCWGDRTGNACADTSLMPEPHEVTRWPRP